MKEFKKVCYDHPYLTGAVIGGVVGGIWYIGYRMGITDGKNNYRKAIGLNVEKVIHNAYDIAEDAVMNAIKEQKPNAIDLIDDLDVVIPDTTVDLIKGTIKFK